jgi:hypothetical protein
MRSTLVAGTDIPRRPAAIEKLPGVITVMKAGGQWQTTCPSARAPKLAVKATRQRYGDNIAT